MGEFDIGCIDGIEFAEADRFPHLATVFSVGAGVDQFLGAPARQAWGAALLLTGYAAAGLALATWLGGRKSPA